MDNDDFTLRMRAEPVPWFGLLFSWLHMLLGIQRLDLKKVIMEFDPKQIKILMHKMAFNLGNKLEGLLYQPQNILDNHLNNLMIDPTDRHIR